MERRRGKPRQMVRMCPSSAIRRRPISWRFGLTGLREPDSESIPVGRLISILILFLHN